MAETIFLVRHGESESNSKRYFAGWYDSPLTELGRRQAELLRKRLSHEPIGRAFCSDLSRARMTYEALQLSCPVEYSPALREKNYGDLEGTAWDDNDGSQMAQHTDPYLRAPNGESIEGVQSRVDAYFRKKIFAAKEREVLVVSHHSPIVLAACSALGMPLARWRCLRLGNCGLSILARENGIWRLTLWNSLSHSGLEHFGPLVPDARENTV